MLKLWKYLLTILFIFSLSSQAEEAKKDKLKIMLEWFANPNHAAIVVAKQKGFFAENNLDVEIIEPSDPTIAPKLLAAGKIDLAVDYETHLHISADQNIPIIRTATLLATPLDILLVREDSEIKSLSDLKNKKVGISTVGLDEAMMKALLEKNGLEEKDVELVNVNFALTASLISKKVDAVIGAMRNFEIYEMREQGVEGRAFYLEEYGIPPRDELIIVAKKDTFFENRDKIKRFNSALEKATTFIINHPDEAWNSFISYRKDLSDPVQKNAWGATIHRLAHRPAALDKGRYENYAKFMQEFGLIKSIPAIDEYAVEP